MSEYDFTAMRMSWEAFQEQERYDIKDEVCYDCGIVVVMPSGNQYDVQGAPRCDEKFQEDAWKNGGFSVECITSDEGVEEEYMQIMSVVGCDSESWYSGDVNQNKYVHDNSEW